MLNNIPKSFTPELLKLLMEMGHGETLLLADGNYPAKANCPPGGVILYIPAESIQSLLADILRFFPLDYVPAQPLAVMEKAAGNGVLQGYEAVAGAGKIECVERFAFYEKAGKVAGIIVTADQTPAANILLQKGVVQA
ncbi:MAG: fucose isomerase [Oscillospiraceae bacterium]|jgi:L-fucose mutarotase|nr:fucose isomerase [Oscillospiraceae bacterium]